MEDILTEHHMKVPWRFENGRVLEREHRRLEQSNLGRSDEQDGRETCLTRVQNRHLTFDVDQGKVD